MRGQTRPSTAGPRRVSGGGDPRTDHRRRPGSAGQLNPRREDGRGWSAGARPASQTAAVGPAARPRTGARLAGGGGWFPWGKETARTAVLDRGAAPSSPRWGCGTAQPRSPSPSFGQDPREYTCRPLVGSTQIASGEDREGKEGCAPPGSRGDGCSMVRERELATLAARLAGNTPAPGDYRVTGDDIGERGGHSRRFAAGGGGRFIFGRSYGDVEELPPHAPVDIPAGSVNRIHHPAFGSRKSAPSLVSNVATKPEIPDNYGVRKQKQFMGALKHENANGQAPLGRHWNRPSSARARGGGAASGWRTPAKPDSSHGGEEEEAEVEEAAGDESEGGAVSPGASALGLSGRRFGSGRGGAGVLHRPGVLMTPPGAGAGDTFYREAEGRLLAPRA